MAHPVRQWSVALMAVFQEAVMAVTIYPWGVYGQRRVSGLTLPVTGE
jgi:hypothetical protein